MTNEERQEVQQAFTAMNNIMDAIKMTPAEGAALLNAYNRVRQVVTKLDKPRVLKGAKNAAD